MLLGDAGVGDESDDQGASRECNAHHEPDRRPIDAGGQVQRCLVELCRSTDDVPLGHQLPSHRVRVARLDQNGAADPG